jgi:hypothetical protein
MSRQVQIGGIVKYLKYYFRHFQDRAPPLKIIAFVRQFKRHHNRDDAQSSRKAAKPLSAVVMLERSQGLGALTDGDTNIFANQARSARHGYRLKAVSELAFEDNFAAAQTNESLPPVIHAQAEQIVYFVRCEGGHVGRRQQGSLSRHASPQHSDHADPDGG